LEVSWAVGAARLDVDTSCARGIGARDDRRVFDRGTATTDAPPPAPSRSPRIAKALPITCVTALNGFGHLVKGFLLPLLQTKSLFARARHRANDIL
jgi:hypothetical protein